MKVKEFIEKLKEYDQEDEVYFHPSPEMFIEDDKTCCGQPTSSFVEEYYLDDGEEQWKEPDSYREELEDNYEPEEVENILSECEKIKGVFIRVEPI